MQMDGLEAAKIGKGKGREVVEGKCEYMRCKQGQMINPKQLAK